MTTDPDVAQEWLGSWTEVQGVEGLVIKGLGQRYLPGARGWFKVRRRQTTEAVIGGVTGTLRRPQHLGRPPHLGRFPARLPGPRHRGRRGRAGHAPAAV